MVHLDFRMRLVKLSSVAALVLVVVLFAYGQNQPGLAVGDLVQDGPATPEQISLLLPVTGPLPQAATATMRYRQSGASAWITGHPLFRIRPEFSGKPAAGSVPDAFAWPILDLRSGTAYDVEVTVSSGGQSVTRTLTHTTRALPPACGPANKTVAVGQSVQTALNALQPGDVLELSEGTHVVDQLQMQRSGTAAAPLCIRGVSKKAILLDDTGYILQVLGADDWILENLTLQGAGVESGTQAASVAMFFGDGVPSQTRVTIRNVEMQGVDKGIASSNGLTAFLAYNNVLVGNNSWTAALIDTNATWNDDGIQAPGYGNAIFNNTLTGFGDSLAYASNAGGGASTQSVGVHFYRNEIRNSGDDMAEVDHAHRNVTLYDNRSHNSMTVVSLDPLYGGPFVAARNIAINVGRSPLKFNSTNSGQFLYNNTVIRTNGPEAHSAWAWIEFKKGAQRSWGFQNNLLIYRGAGNLLAFEASGNDPIDFSHNSWFPDGSVWWTNSGGSARSLAATYEGLPPTKPVFSGLRKRHEQDNITTSNPFAHPVDLGESYLTEVMTAYLPALAAGVAKGTGTPIAGITDGFTGKLPDRGAVIEGRPAPRYGAERSDGR